MSAVADLWWPVIEGARWFSGKGRGGRVANIRSLGWLVPPDEPVAVRPEIVEVVFGDGAEFYQLWVSYRPAQSPPGPADIGVIDGMRIGDAPRDPEAMAAVARRLAAPGEGIDPALRYVQRQQLPQPLYPTQWYPGQQSNTNVFLGTEVLLKIFRRLEPGANLDIELSAELQDRGVRAVPAVYGWLETDLAGDRYDLAALSELLHHPQDGWDLAVASCHDGTDFTADADALGHALREVHNGLGPSTFARSGDEIADRMTTRLDAAITAAPVLAEFRTGLQRVFDRIRGHLLPVQRVHGDFHLGQTLRTDDGWKIIDFEGEPLKPMAERRAEDSVWRDVAGMLRSFAYAAETATDPLRAATWPEQQRSAFLDAYRVQRDAADEAALEAYEADKAIYEVLYETRNRPEWVGIPLADIRRLSAATAPEHSDAEKEHPHGDL